MVRNSHVKDNHRPAADCFYDIRSLQTQERGGWVGGEGREREREREQRRMIQNKQEKGVTERERERERERAETDDSE